jgi:hypothetical protein
VLKNGESMLRGEGRVVGFKDKAHAGEAGLSLRFTRLDARSKALVDQAASLRDARARGTATSTGAPAAALATSSIPSPFPPSLPPSRASVAPPRPAAASATPPPLPSRRAPPPLPAWARSQFPPVAPPSRPSSAIEVEIEVNQVNSDFHVDAPPVIPFEEPIAPRPPPLVAAKAAERAPSELPPRVLAAPPAQPAPPTRPDDRHRSAAPSPSLPPIEDREVFLARLRSRARSLPESRVREILAKRT